MQLTHSTKQRLLDVGLAMLLEHGYHGLGIQTLLDAARTPKGSFYHHFNDKEDFALQVIDQYMQYVHAGLDECLGDKDRPPLERVRRFFELTRKSYKKEGYLGCLLGGLGQELSGTNEVFRHRIEKCFSEIAERTARCLEEARQPPHHRPNPPPPQPGGGVGGRGGGAEAGGGGTPPRPFPGMLDFSSSRQPCAKPARGCTASGLRRRRSS